MGALQALTALAAGQGRSLASTALDSMGLAVKHSTKCAHSLLHMLCKVVSACSKLQQAWACLRQLQVVIGMLGLHLI